MDIIAQASELRPAGRPVCVAIGFFDGVHLGHQHIIRQTITDATQHDGISLVITFDRHPNTVVAPDRAPSLIYPLSKKLLTIERIGVDSTLLLHFDAPFSKVTGEDFIRQLVKDLRSMKSLSVGVNFVFGHQRGGNVDLLKVLGQELGFGVNAMASLSLDGKPVSSTRVRATLDRGELQSVSQMLGRPYSLCGTVIQGDRLGRQIGFPTANLNVEGLALPPGGVYAALAHVHGAKYHAVLNLGHRPTINQTLPPMRVEAHLLRFSGDLYNQPLELEFVGKLRDEQKFPSLAALQEQIAHDITAAEHLFQSAQSRLA